MQTDGVIERINKNIPWNSHAEATYLLWDISDGLMDIINNIEIMSSSQ
jgi:hypothetical protein